MKASPAALLVDAGAAARTLSLGEELLWQAERQGADVPAFLDCPLVLPSALRLLGNLDIGALSRSLDEIVTRHEVLRSVFAHSEAGPVRTIAAEGSPLEVVDLRSSTSKDLAAEALTMLGAELRQGFRADEPPLFRARLYALGNEDHVLAFLIHHIVFDGWSRRVLARDLEALYAGALDGVPSALEPLAVRYSDYVASQDDLQPEVRRRQLEEYWERQLLGAPILTLADRDGGSRSTVADQCVFSIPEAETTRLRLAARQHKVTLATALLALFAGALQRLTGSDDIVMGMPISDRRRLDFEPLIGLFANTLVLRLNLADARDFSGAVSVAQRQMSGAIDHQELHYAHLIRRGDAGLRAPFSVLFNFIPAVPGTGFRLRGVEVTESKVAAIPQSIADLTFHISDRRSELTGTILYKRDSFTPGRVEALSACFRTLVSGVVDSAAVTNRA
jgi:hypothetical protein